MAAVPSLCSANRAADMTVFSIWTLKCNVQLELMCSLHRITSAAKEDENILAHISSHPSNFGTALHLCMRTGVRLAVFAPHMARQHICLTPKATI